jgi:hypothetical protein
MKRGLFPVALLAAFLGVAGPTDASIVVYTTEADFLAATAGLTTIDFNGIADPGGFVGYGPGPLVLSGVTFSGNGAMFVIDPGFYASNYPDGFLNSDFAPVNTIVAALPGAYTAIAFDFGGLFGPATFTVTLSDGTFFEPFSAASITGTGTLEFVGLTSTVPVSSVTFDMPDADNYNAIDNFRFGRALTVPEPSSASLMGIAAVCGLASALRSKRNRRVRAN